MRPLRSACESGSERGGEQERRASCDANNKGAEWNPARRRRRSYRVGLGLFELFAAIVEKLNLKSSEGSGGQRYSG